SSDLKDKLKGEVHFLRAYLYHMLVSMYGGVPIIEQAYKLGDDYEAPRNTYGESIDFIVSECDKAASLLNAAEDKGRATKGAALALKARVLLHAASDLYNSDRAWTMGYANPELIGYTGGDRTQRWQAAKEAAAAVMVLGYELHKKDPGLNDDIAVNYGEIFLLKDTS